MAGLILRPTVRADLAEVDALLARAYPKLLKADYPPSVLVTALPLISRAQPALVASGTYFAALRDRQILGVGGWTRDRGRRNLGHVRHIAVDDRVPRQGIGRAVLAHLMAHAHRAGVVELECWSTYTAEPFYAASGFRKEGPMEVELRPGITFPAIRMRADLAMSG